MPKHATTPNKQSSKKEKSTPNKGRCDTKQTNKKRHVESSSDSSSYSDSDDSSYEYSSEPDDEESEEFDMQEYRRELAKIFPSKHIDNKVASGDALLKKADARDIITKSKKNSAKHSTSSNSNARSTTKSNKKPDDKKKVSKKKECVSESESDTPSDDEEESFNDSDSDEDEDTVDDEEDEDEVKKSKKKRNKINIVFTIGGENGEEDDEWETDSYGEDYSSEDDSDDISEEEDEDVEVSDVESDEGDADAVEGATKVSNEASLKTAEALLSTLMATQLENKDNQTFKDCVKACETAIVETKTKITKKDAKQKAKNARIFKKMLKRKSTTNDFHFFKQVDSEQQKKIIKELREINKHTQVEKPYRISLLESSMPIEFKSAAMKRINTLKHMEQGSGEYYKIKNWVDTFMKIPFGVYDTLPVSLSDGVDACHNFMENALAKLNTSVYGLNDAKMQIMQMIGQLISNPASVGSSIAIHGPMGTGKTSLVREGISRILNRPFAFIALGGATDSSFLEGHSYTYEGSTWGQIVQILIASKCMNPVIYFDELDKISDTPKGEEIASILTHLTDSSQNTQFHDKYFSDVDFDLSKCLFIFSYNDESKINPILRDRMYKIKTSGYNMKEKVIIANQYLLPRIREQVKFDNESITIPDESLQYIVDMHCCKEDGVRNFKRCLEIIYSKLNLYRLMKPGTNLFEQEISLKVEFPFVVTKDMVDKIIKLRKENETWKNLYN
jgi:ATP-dependent Lon protease